MRLHEFTTSMYILLFLLQAGSLAAIDKALSCMDEAKRKKLADMVQEAAAAKRPGGGGAAAPRPPLAASSSNSRGASQAASVSALF